MDTETSINNQPTSTTGFASTGNMNTTQMNDNSGFADMAAKFQANHRVVQEQAQAKRRTKNNVWAEVAEVEEIQNTADQFNVVSIIDKFIIKRGPESYEVGNKRKRPAPEDGEKAPKPKMTFKQKRPRRTTAMETGLGLDDDDDKSSDSDTDYESDSSISSGGLSDDCREELTKRTVAKKLTFQGREVPKNLKKRTSREIMEEQIKDQEDYQVANFIANRLKETKKRLIQKTMRILEREKTMQLFWKTLKIERLGGLMIKNNSRRRTPGGVFLYLLRNDKRVDQEKIKEIFHEDREERKTLHKSEKLEKDQQFFSHLARVMKKKRPGASKSNRKDDHSNTDSEEEELADSYQLPPKTSSIVEPAPAFFKFGIPAPGPLAPVLVMPSAPVPESLQPPGLPNQGRACVSYDDDFLDINCEQDEFL